MRSSIPVIEHADARVSALARRWLAFALAIAFIVAATRAGAAPWDVADQHLPAVPALTGRVIDTTRTLTESERSALEAKLAAWESRTTNQLVVAMVPTTVPESIEEYSLRLAEAWKIGQKDKDNGALFVVAKDDKRMRIEVGYGLEGVLTDVTSRRIIAEDVAPYFKQGKFAEGVNAGIDRIMAVVDSGNPLPIPQAASAARSRSNSNGGGLDLGTLVVLLLFVVPLFGGVLRSMFGNVAGSTLGGGLVAVAAWFVAGSLVIAVAAGVIAFFAMLLSLFGGRAGGGFIPMGGGFGRGGGFGGGGFGGGGFGGGGFSGGGGTFGGGGASGGWN